MTDFPKRGEIWLARLDPAIGAEIKKTRPAIVVSNNLNNQYADLVTIVPISGESLKTYPFEIAIPVEKTGLSKPSKAKCQQIKTLDKMRLVKRLGAIDQALIFQIDEALKLHLGIE